MNAPPEKKQITLTCAVDAYRSGWTIVEFLAHRFKYHTAEGWENRVRERWVRVNGAAVAPDHAVVKGDEVAYTIWHAEPPVDERYDVLYEDGDILAVSKSGNIPVHACGVFITHTLIARLKADFGPELNLCHRLDRETSGVVVLAKHKEANRALAGAFARGEVEKKYVAVVYGRVSRRAFVIDAPIGKVDIRYQYPVEYEHGKKNDLATYLPKRVVDTAGGKPARTRCERLREVGDFTVLRATPEQGRTNQIRVHLAHAGHPIVGDKIYALTGEVRDELLRDGLTDRVRAALVLERHALHCEWLRFEHPGTGKTMEVRAEVPGDMRRWVDGAPRESGTG
jgi:23S rRNA pseudouridine1911/1915/1917 synthase